MFEWGSRLLGFSSDDVCAATARQPDKGLWLCRIDSNEQISKWKKKNKKHLRARVVIKKNYDHFKQHDCYYSGLFGLVSQPNHSVRNHLLKLLRTVLPRLPISSSAFPREGFTRHWILFWALPACLPATRAVFVYINESLNAKNIRFCSPRFCLRSRYPVGYVVLKHWYENIFRGIRVHIWSQDIFENPIRNYK